MNHTAQQKQAYSIGEFCQLYSIGRTKVYEEIKQGRLKILKIGKRTIITTMAANQWIENLSAGGNSDV